eukprot:TRINITY_DN69_c0_g1_i1.p1 TRINITY_DN69_c0_g1~~TRINITY_DN69_c0_g1_i1.p1  ORF type:complete len:261 (-),score=8.47 TRINITY_DN69_c0_g1_i1:116-898(-)
MVFVLGTYFDSLMQVVAQSRAAEQTITTPLPDLLFDILPFIPPIGGPHGIEWANIAVGCILTIGIARFVLSTQLKIVVFRRWLTLLGVLFFGRGVCIVVTMLPNPDRRCVPEKPKAALWEALLVMLQMYPTCMDVFYSGHTTNITIAALIWWRYTPIAPLWVPRCWQWVNTTKGIQLQRMLMLVLVLIAYFLILCTRFHYTLDVMIAISLCFVGDYVYHTSLLSLMANPTQPHNYLLRCIRWLECEDAPLDADYEHWVVV